MCSAKCLCLSCSPSSSLAGVWLYLRLVSFSSHHARSSMYLTPVRLWLPRPLARATGPRWDLHRAVQCAVRHAAVLLLSRLLSTPTAFATATRRASASTSAHGHLCLRRTRRARSVSSRRLCWIVSQYPHATLPRLWHVQVSRPSHRSGSQHEGADKK